MMNTFRIAAIVGLFGWTSLVALSAYSAAPGAQAAAQTGAGTSQQERGKAAYVDKCSECHQENLKGNNDTPPLSGDMFWGNWETYNANNLLEQMRTTMPEDNPGSLDRQTYVDILAYILKFNEVPMTGDLPSDADSLKKIVIKRKE